MRRSFALFALLAVLPAAAQQIDDPANLMGERVSPPALADTLPINHGAPALEQLLRKLRTRASMMLIVAHPDDEDSGLLTYESRGMGARVAMLTLTRGEGGQNLMTADFNDALGLIRTQELLAEDRYTGTDQFFGTEVDFGFSKTKEEAFKKWTHDRVLYDAVRAVRLYRPLVLASVFVGGVTDGHGQHQVSGEICQEVFLAAADPKVFPEMGLPPWAPLRVFARVPFSRVTEQGMFDYATGRYSPPRFHNYVTGADITHEPAATVTIHEGDKPDIPAFNGMSYVQWARQGLALQKSQIGPNVRIPPAGAFDVGYTLMASRLSCIATKPGCPIQSAASSRNEWASAEPTAFPSRSESPNQDLFSGIDTSLPAIADLAPTAPPVIRSFLRTMDARLAEAQRLYSPDHLERSALALRDALSTLEKAIPIAETASLPPDQKINLLHELRIKRVQLNNALVLALSLKLEPMVKPAHANYAVPLTTTADSIYTDVQITNGAPTPLKLLHLEPQDLTSSLPPKELLAPGSTAFAESTSHPATPPSPTRPYFSRPDLEQPFYDIGNPALRNAPATPDPLVSSAIVDYQGVSLELKSVVPDSKTVASRSTPPETAALLPPRIPQPAVFIPPVSLSLRRTAGTPPFTSRADLEQSLNNKPADSFGILPLDTASFQLGALLGVKAFEPSVLGPATIGPDKIPVTLGAPEDWHISAPAYNPAFEPVFEHFTLTAGLLKPGQTVRLTATATFDHRIWAEGFRPVGYPGLTYTNLYIPAVYRITAVDVTTAPNLKIAYLPGTGDEVAQFLPSLGVNPDILTPKDLTLANLSKYDAVLLGVRAYAAHPELSGSGSKPLQDFAAQGGVVVVQYNSGGFDPASAPFPYTLPGDPAHNVVEEEQPVTLLQPTNPLLTWPNRITSADFDHWIEERGHGFASDWSPEYTPLLETHDLDQNPQKGGLLLAKVGKGAYIYCAFALYRQLPEGVPGAYRLMANLLSYAKNPGR